MSPMGVQKDQQKTYQEELWLLAWPQEHGSSHYRTSYKLFCSLTFPLPHWNPERVRNYWLKSGKVGERWGNRVGNEEWRTTTPFRPFDCRKPKSDKGRSFILKPGFKFWQLHAKNGLKNKTKQNIRLPNVLSRGSPLSNKVRRSSER